MVLEENDGSQVAQPHVSGVDVEIPQDFIRRMGVGFFCPIEGHLLADREELCSTQVEPSSTQENQANGATISPTQEQVEDPPTRDQVTMQEPRSPIINASQDQGQDQPSTPNVEDYQVDQGQHSGQDGDSNYQDDQVILSRNNDEIKARLIARRA